MGTGQIKYQKSIILNSNREKKKNKSLSHTHISHKDNISKVLYWNLKTRDNHKFKGTMENFLREIALVAEQAFIRRKWVRVAGGAAISKDI